jgi:hypothetical protein
MNLITPSFILIIIVLSCLVSNCTSTIDPEEEIKNATVKHYTEKYGFVNEPFYQPKFHEYYNDTIHRYYWDLEENAVESHIELFFNPFDKERFKIRDEGINYSHFGVIFHRQGKILQKGFFDDSLRFSGTMYHYHFDDLIINKDMYMLDNKFYEVFYQIDSIGNLIDSTYKYFLIVNPDIDTFYGPDLSTCFDVQLIIDTNKYDYEDFEIAYSLFDSKNLDDIQDMLDRDKIFEDSLPVFTKGHYRFCHDLEILNHLMMVFYIIVDSGISSQDLTFGKTYGPIINKNIDSTDL